MAGIVLSILGTAVLAAALWLGTRWLYGYCRMIYYIGRIPKPTPNGHWLFGHIFEVLYDATTPARIHCAHMHARTPSAQSITTTCTPSGPRPSSFYFSLPLCSYLPPCQSTMIKMIARNRSTGHALTATWVGPFISLVAITHPEPLKQLLKGTEGRRLCVATVPALFYWKLYVSTHRLLTTPNACQGPTKTVRALDLSSRGPVKTPALPYCVA